MSSSELQSRDEQLTAYLDGELSMEESSNVESQLVVDESLRLRLAQLRKSYDLLDEVPETPYNQRFTQSTVELVVQEISSSKIPIEPVRPTTSGVTISKIAPPVTKTLWNWPRLAYLLAGLFAIGLMTGVCTKLFLRNAEIRQLGLAANVPGLFDVHDISIAERLAKEMTAFEVLKSHYGEDVVPATPKSIFERKRWVDSLTANQLDRVVRGREILKKQTPEVNHRLEALESQIESHPNSQSIQDVIRIVGLVFDDLPSYKRQDLDSKNLEKRYLFLRDSILFEAADIYAQQIPESDAKAIDDWHARVFIPTIDEQFGDDPNTTMGSRQAAWILIREFSVDPNFHLQKHEEILPSLLATLTPTAQQLLSPLSKSDQTRVFELWVRRNKDNNKQLDDYERMRPDRRERIDLVDPDNGPRFGSGRRL